MNPPRTSKTAKRQHDGPDGGSGVAALERGLKVLLAFRDADGPLRLADLAARTGLYKSTILRLCVSLERMGFISRPDNGVYQLGGAVFQLGWIYQRSFRLEELVMPMLRDLAAESGESASFYVRDGDQQVVLHRVDSPSAISESGVREGDRFPVYDGSALGDVLRAFSGEDGEAFDAIRRSFFAFSSGTRSQEAAAATSPVFGHDQRLVGALSLSGPKHRFTEAAIAAMRRQLIAAARRLTRSLGGDATVYEET